MAFTPAKRIHQNYIPELDGLRGIAILLVVTFHYFGGYFYFFSFGWSGVDLFFVLSGYLITSRLLATRDHDNYFSKFYINRALRIWPLYYLVLILFYAAFNLLVKESYLSGFKFYNENALSFFLFFENWTIMQTNGLRESHLQHFWSLAIEEQFYIVWPLFIFIFSKKKYIVSVLYACVFGIIILRTYLYFTYPGKDLIYFYNTICRMDSFIIGGIFYFLFIKNPTATFRYILPIVSFILFFGIFLSGTKSSTLFMSTIGYTLLAIFFGTIVYLAAKKKNNYLKSFLGNAWLIYLGKISYGLYIFHWLVLKLLQSKIIQFFNYHFSIGQPIILWISIIMCLTISVLLSVISYFYFELYFLKRKAR